MQQTFAGHFFNALSWTLIHSLWQGLILTIVAGTILSATKRAAPSFRYSLFTALLFCFIGSTLVTFAWQWQIETGSSTISLAHTTQLTDQIESSQQNWWNEFTKFINQFSAWIIPAWSVIVLLKLVRMFADLYYINRLRTTYINKPENAWTIRLQELVHEMGIQKKVVLLESKLVNIPIVAGHFKPIILVPLGILTRLAPAEVEAVLLHELAHIRRHDYLVNLVQRVTCIIFFFNPGVLWLSSLIRSERENCCDDIAITHTNDKLQFVEALIRVKQHSLSAPPLAMNFLGQKNLLLHRVSRIVSSENKTLNIPELLFLGFSIICTILLFGMAGRTAQPNKDQLQVAQHVHPVTYLINFTSDTSKQHEPVSVISDTKQPSVFNDLFKQAPTNRSIEEGKNKAQHPISEHMSFLRTVSVENGTAPQAHVADTARPSYSQLENDRINAAHDREQAEKDRVQADIDRKKASLDYIQAEKDRAQADIDRKQAEKDRARADIDRKQAEKDRAEAEVFRNQAENYRASAFPNTKPVSL